jgi:subtilisin family serine protease
MLAFMAVTATSAAAGSGPATPSANPTTNQVNNNATATKAAAEAAKPAASGAVIRDAHTGTEVPDSYIVVLKKTDQVRAKGIGAIAKDLAGTHHGKLGYVYDRVLGGFSVQMSEADALQLTADPNVDHITQAQAGGLADTQDVPDWGLDRVDQRALPLDGRYSYPTNGGGGDTGNGGRGVTAYILDSGINVNHLDFSGRASYGWDFTSNTSTANDCNGHGTHVAGIIGGDTYGVAKNVKLVAVRVTDCNGGWTSPNLLAGINWITANATKPAVVNASLGFTCNSGGRTCPPGTGTDIDAAITTSIASGLTWTVAAGNDNRDACGTPLSGVPAAITVAASTNADTKASYSNWGSCVNVWAPGGDFDAAGQLTVGTAIMSDYIGSNTATKPLAGTSMASPKVAGAAALILARPGWADKQPADVLTELDRLAPTVTIDLTPAHNSTTRLLFTGPPPANGGSISVARTSNGRLALFGVTIAGAFYHREQTATDATSVTGWTGWSSPATTPGWYSACADTGSGGRVILTGLATSQQVWRRTQSSDGAGWNPWKSFNGLLTSCAVAMGSDNRLRLFGTNRQGQVWTSIQILSGVDLWGPFTQIPMIPVRDVVAERNANDMIEIFAVDYAGAVWHTWQTSPGTVVGPDTYNLWQLLGGQTLDTITVARNSNGLLTLYGVDLTGKIVLRDQVLGVNAWLDWQTHVSNDATAAFQGKIRDLATETNPDGTVDIFAVDNTGNLWQTLQQKAGSDTYTPWEHFTDTLLLRP